MPLPSGDQSPSPPECRPRQRLQNSAATLAGYWNRPPVGARRISPRKARGDADACRCAGRGQRGGCSAHPGGNSHLPVRRRPPCMLRRPWELLVPSFPCSSQGQALRRQESRRSVGVKGAPNVRRRPIMRGALGALVGRRADGSSSHRWAVAWIPASAGMTDREPPAPTELIFNTVALSLISPRRAGGEYFRASLAPAGMLRRHLNE